MSKKQPTKQAAVSDVPAVAEATGVQVAESNVDNFEVPLTAEPINHIQTTETYELPSINPATVEVTAPIDDSEEVEATVETDLSGVDDQLRSLATGHSANTTGFEVDAAVELFLSSDDRKKSVPHLKYRLGCLAAEANEEVAKAISNILKAIDR